MSILGKILSKILGRDEKAAPALTGMAPSPSFQDVVSGSTSTAPPVTTPVVDVEAVMTDLASRNPQKLNWRTSIVDLMKLLGMESSLSERRELARELGYSGSTSDTATMNMWLHKEVLRRVAENGGRVPASLLD
jgi:hypothetical protein